jgi:DNA-binding CsgD family transcriptional regulator
MSPRKGVTVAERISEREAEVLAALGARLSNAQIANQLHISVRTVESHVSSLLRKHGAADRWGLAELARSGAREPGRIAGLRASGTTFVGRGAERAAVLAAIEEARLVTLLGPGGVGKTRLAAVVAEESVALFPSGGAFVDLVPVRDGFVARAVATALGVTEGSHQPLAEAVAARLGTGRWLLVLDNCEHVIDEAAGFAERILAACPGTRVLVTSRERLGVPGERSVPISPLPLGADAERLFRDRALAADPQFVAEPAVIAELCARLDGLPLAIELAAARGASLGATGLLAALEDALRLLSGGRRARSWPWRRDCPARRTYSRRPPRSPRRTTGRRPASPVRAGA